VVHVVSFHSIRTYPYNLFGFPSTKTINTHWAIHFNSKGVICFSVANKKRDNKIKCEQKVQEIHNHTNSYYLSIANATPFKINNWEAGNIHNYTKQQISRIVWPQEMRCDSNSLHIWWSFLWKIFFFKDAYEISSNVIGTLAWSFGRLTYHSLSFSLSTSMFVVWQLSTAGFL
jgi:hypothetical protein